MPSGSGTFRARIFLLGALFLGCAFLLVYRLYEFQWLQREKYREQATRNYERTIEVPAQRGSIFDAQGNPLAVTIQLDAVSVTGKDLKEPKKAEQTALALSALLGMPAIDVFNLIDPNRDDPVTIKDQLPAAVADRIRDAIDAGALPGVTVQPRPVRQYPEGPIASPILGFLGRDREGLAGLEWYFESELAGAPGLIETEVDTTDKEIILARRIVQPPRDGTDLILTLDRWVQRMLERELAEAVRANKASGGLVLVMEPSTGGILGMTSYPTYAVSDPMVFRQGEDALHKAVSVTNQYEPGSVMKLVTMASALELGSVTPNTMVNDNGIVTFQNGRGRPPTTIKNWDLRANGTISATEVLVRSSNVGTYQVAQRVGPAELYRFFNLFGFGERTGIQLPGEVPGTVRTPDDPAWSVVDLATNAFGQGIAVTPLQMLNAVAAIGNDGVLMRPTIVRQMDGPDGPRRPEPQQIRRVISADAARTLREMMVTVIEQPALISHRIPGIQVAGKTGTADFPTDLGYNTGKTFASIVALLPADRPKLAILIRLDAPEAMYGGTAAAPVLKRVGSELATYYRISATTNGR
ncbi:MAG TPA: penicillin-binding protein 2 [Chloroflexota bacterium]|nr:penicillin-binding protein 2 [Chloroflexota bacterium]